MPAPASRFRSLLLGALVLVPLALPATTLADALVHVEVRAESGGSADGTVTLRPRGSEGDENAPSYSCTTDGGSCSIDGVPGGRYQATFTPRGGEAQAPRSVMIPPSGTVRLRVSAH